MQKFLVKVRGNYYIEADNLLISHEMKALVDKASKVPHSRICEISEEEYKKFQLYVEIDEMSKDSSEAKSYLKTLSEFAENERMQQKSMYTTEFYVETRSSLDELFDDYNGNHNRKIIRCTGVAKYALDAIDFSFSIEDHEFNVSASYDKVHNTVEFSIEPKYQHDEHNTLCMMNEFVYWSTFSKNGFRFFFVDYFDTIESTIKNFTKEFFQKLESF